jgi:hypothetical protein
VKTKYDSRTKGDWTLLDDGKGDHVFSSRPPSRRIANLYGGLSNPESLANGMLIADAPALFEALVKIVEAEEAVTASYATNDNNQVILACGNLFSTLDEAKKLIGGGE